MADKIFLINGDSELTPMIETMYEREDHLQALLEKYPDLLAGDQIDSSEPRRWVLVKREMGVSDPDGSGDRWSLDHLFLDQAGILTLIEVKRSTDTRIRREVVGQMLDYAANAGHSWPLTTIRASFDETCRSRSVNPEAEIAKLLLVPPESEIAPAVEAYWLKVEKNIKDEQIRMVFVADDIPRELKRVIEFLNGQMNPAMVLGVELKQYVGSNLKTLVPRVVGLTAKAEMQKSSRAREGRKWDEPGFLAAVQAETPDALPVMGRLIAWFNAKAEGVQWGNGQGATFTGRAEIEGENRELMRVFSDGRVMFSLRSVPESQREQFRQKLDAIAGLNLSAAKDHPATSAAALKDEQRWKQVTSLCEGFLQQWV